MNEKPLGPSARRQVELVFQGDLLEGGQGIDAEAPAAGLRQRDVGDVPIAVRAEGRLALLWMWSASGGLLCARR
jgi:hypothetical protein